MPQPRLVLRAVSCAGRPLEVPIVATIDEQGGTVGRATDNLLVLPDPERVISRQHAAIAYRNGRFVLSDNGSAVPVQHNGQIVGHGREVEVAPGDELRIGPYVLRVENAAVPDTERDPEATLVMRRQDLAAAQPVGAALLSWQSGGDPARSDGITSVVFPEAPNADAAPAAQMDVPLPSAARATQSVPASTGRRDATHTSAPIDAAATLPLPARPSQDASEASVEELLGAFLKGAAIPGMQIPGGLSPEFVRELGRMLNEAVRGILDLLQARALSKREVRAEATMIVATDNNPLKFSPNLDAALASLLTPRGHGFLPPLASLEDAFEGLSSHQRGFIAGMRAVLGVVLARFDPKILEERLAEPSVADSLLPMNRKAKLWDSFAELYGELSRESAQDFQELFGQDFLRAYEAQVALSRASGKAS